MRRPRCGHLGDLLFQANVFRCLPNICGITVSVALYDEDNDMLTKMCGFDIFFDFSNLLIGCSCSCFKQLTACKAIQKGIFGKNADFADGKQSFAKAGSGNWGN